MGYALVVFSMLSSKCGILNMISYVFLRIQFDWCFGQAALDTSLAQIEIALQAPVL